jgi:hypothetical protein
MVNTTLVLLAGVLAGLAFIAGYVHGYNKREGDRRDALEAAQLGLEPDWYPEPISSGLRRALFIMLPIGAALWIAFFWWIF